MAKPVSIFGKESQATAIQHRKPMLSRVFIAISSIIALVTFQHAVATEVNDTNQPLNDTNQPQKRRPFFNLLLMLRAPRRQRAMSRTITD